MEELKPCPFCGCQPRMTKDPNDGEYRVKCWFCGATSRYVTKEEDAAKIWNRRDA